MLEYQQTSRYYHIYEDPDLVQTDLSILNLPFTETTVMEGEQNNPEILAQRIYNNPHYWWVICQYNGIIDPDNIPAGLIIRFPTIVQAPRVDQ